MLGKVKWFDRGRGIGLIEKEQGGVVQLHRVEIENAGRISVSSGELVEFDTKADNKGEKAINLHILS